MASSSLQVASAAAEPQRPFTPPHAAPEPDTLESARRPAYIGFLFRAPFATDAYKLGFTTGIREDYRLQIDSYRNVDLEAVVLTDACGETEFVGVRRERRSEEEADICRATGRLKGVRLGCRVRWRERTLRLGRS